MLNSLIKALTVLNISWLQWLYEYKLISATDQMFSENSRVMFTSISPSDSLERRTHTHIPATRSRQQKEMSRAGTTKIKSDKNLDWKREEIERTRNCGTDRSNDVTRTWQIFFQIWHKNPKSPDFLKLKTSEQNCECWKVIWKTRCWRLWKNSKMSEWQQYLIDLDWIIRN